MVVDPTQVLQLGVNGLVLGSILALAALGLTLVYGILDLANFAHGDLLTLGAYLGLFFANVIALPAVFAWALVVAGAILLGVIVDRIARPWLADAFGPVSEDGKLSATETQLGFVAAFVLLAMVAGLVVDAPVTGSWGLLVVVGLALAGILAAAARARSLPRRKLGLAAGGGLGLAVGLVFVVGPLTGWTVTWPFALAAGLLVPVVALVRVQPGLASRSAARAGLAAAGLAAGFLLATPLLLAIVLSLILVGAFTVVLDLLIWRPMRSKDAGLLTLIIISIGLALAIRNGVIMTWGTGVADFPTAGGGPLQLLPGVLITRIQLIVIGVTVATIGLVHVLLRHTALGKAMRALADDMDLARITGIDVDRIILYVWFLSGSLAALAGVLVGLLRPFTTNVGWFLLLPIFAAVILGGIGSPYGAMAGGFVIGITMETSLAFGVPSDYRLAVGFGIMILVLIVRPEGIFGGQATR